MALGTGSCAKRRFTLKKLGNTENASEKTTNYHNEEKLEAWMRKDGLRFTRGLHHAAPDDESQTIAANAIVRTQQTDIDENLLRLGSWISRLGNPGSW